MGKDHYLLYSLLLGKLITSFNCILIRYTIPVIYYDKEYIIRAGEKAEHFYIIKKGKVEILSRDAKEVVGLY